MRIPGSVRDGLGPPNACAAALVRIDGLDGRAPHDQLHVMDAAQGGMGACIMDATFLVVCIASIYLAARIAEHRGRRIKVWAWIAFVIGPFAIPLVLLFPDLRGTSGEQA